MFFKLKPGDYSLYSSWEKIRARDVPLFPLKCDSRRRVACTKELNLLDLMHESTMEALASRFAKPPPVDYEAALSRMLEFRFFSKKKKKDIRQMLDEFYACRDELERKEQERLSPSLARLHVIKMFLRKVEHSCDLWMDRVFMRTIVYGVKTPELLVDRLVRPGDGVYWDDEWMPMLFAVLRNLYADLDGVYFSSDPKRLYTKDCDRVATYWVFAQSAHKLQTSTPMDWKQKQVCSHCRRDWHPAGTMCMTRSELSAVWGTQAYLSKSNTICMLCGDVFVNDREMESHFCQNTDLLDTRRIWREAITVSRVTDSDELRTEHLSQRDWDAILPPDCGIDIWMGMPTYAILNFAEAVLRNPCNNFVVLDGDSRGRVMTRSGVVKKSEKACLMLFMYKLFMALVNPAGGREGLSEQRRNSTIAMMIFHRDELKAMLSMRCVRARMCHVWGSAHY